MLVEDSTVALQNARMLVEDSTMALQNARMLLERGAMLGQRFVNSPETPVEVTQQVIHDLPKFGLG
jgi:hypothetical protein